MLNLLFALSTLKTAPATVALCNASPLIFVGPSTFVTLDGNVKVFSELLIVCKVLLPKILILVAVNCFSAPELFSRVNDPFVSSVISIPSGFKSRESLLSIIFSVCILDPFKFKVKSLLKKFIFIELAVILSIFKRSEISTPLSALRESTFISLTFNDIFIIR